MLSKSKALIFDMDGVIIDTIDFHYIGWKNYLKKWNVNLTREHFKDKMFGTPGRDAVMELINEEHTFESVLKHCDNVDAEFRRVIADYPGVEPVKGFKEFAENAFKRGYLIALGTSAPKENVDVIFNRFGISGLFKTIVTSEDFIHGKPHPEVYLKTLDRLGVSAADAVVFEDSLAGVASGVAAGINVIGLTTSQSDQTLRRAGARFTVNNFLELDLKSIEELLRSN